MGRQEPAKMNALRTGLGRAVQARSFHASRAAKSNVVIPGEAHHTEHAVQATADWKKYSKYSAMIVGGIAVLEFFVHMSHAGHHHDAEVYPFRKIRNKPFPWGDGQHSLFGCGIDDVE